MRQVAPETGRPLLFIESNTSGTGRLFVQRAREIGCHPVLITSRPDTYAYLSEAGAPEVLCVPRVAPSTIEDVVRRRFGRAADVAGVTSSSEYFVATAAAVAARFGLAGPDASCIEAARDKAYQRAVLSAGGLPVPPFRVVRSAAEAVSAARETGVPVVVKPVGGSGSIGVRACACEADAGRHAAMLLAHAERPEDARVLTEALIEGPELSVEVFCGRVVGVTQKYLGPRPHFVEVGHDYPGIPLCDASILCRTVERAAALLALTWGPLHWELRMHDGRAYVIEVNVRLAGGFIPELVRHAEGIDLIRQTLRLVVGQRPDLEARHHRHASIRFLCPPTSGRLTAVEGLDAARTVEDVVEVALYRRIGERLAMHGDFRDRIGHVMVCADRLDDARAAVARAHEMVRIDVEGTV